MEQYQKKDGFKSEKIIVLPEYVLDEIAVNPLIQVLYITDIGYFPNAKYHYRERTNGCDSYIFIFCTEGEGWVELNGSNPIEVNNQTLIVIPTETPHRYGASENNPWSIYWFHLKGSQVKALIDCYPLCEGPVKIPISGTIMFNEIFNQCFDTLSNKPYSHIHHINISQAIKYLISTIGLLSVRTQQKEKRDIYLERSISYMNENINSTITLIDLAKYTGLSKQHLTHLFKQETSFSPIDYFLRMKINRAGQMLILTDLTIKQIAILIGIEDPYYFSRIFKKIIGYSPSEYRKNKKG